MSERKIYVVGGGSSYMNWCEADPVRKMEDASIVLFTGGEDVSPHLYDRKSHPTTGANYSRDRYEVEAFRKARVLDLPMLGICRGSQFLCAMSGGILVQHQSHDYIHPITTNDGRVFNTTSTHHQRAHIAQMNKDDVELVAWAEHLSPFSYGEDDADVMDEDKECEIVFYKNTKALGIQGHPEFIYPPREDWQADFITYCRELITKYLEV